MYYYINYFFLFSIIGHFIETVFIKNFTSGILYGWWTPVYGFGVVLILLIGKLIDKIPLRHKKIYKIFITYIVSMVVLSLIELMGGYLIKSCLHKEIWNYESHRFHIGHYISLEMTLVWGAISIIFIYIVHPLLKGIIKEIPPFITIILVVLFLFDCTKTFIDKKKS